MGNAPPSSQPETKAPPEALATRRARAMGPNVPTFYRTPLHIVEGRGVWLADAEGRRYLDAYNNVPHVGHGHPKVVAAVAGQMARLNVHSRYLHEAVPAYIERLGATFGHGLGPALLTCTGSEANDVALRIAEAWTGRTGLVATDATYHGNTRALSQLSTRRPPIGGYPGHVRLIPPPEGDGTAFAAALARAIGELEDAGHGFAALILCPIFANEGLIEPRPGLLDAAANAVRAAGGLLIADEIQPGFGRIGSHWWGHQALGLAPDVVTLGKAMGNGYPVAGLVTRPELLAAFREAFGYFNTFAATPVAAAAASAMLDVMEEESLRENAATTGAHLKAGLTALSHPAIAGVRGAGLSLAVTLHGPEAPARAEAAVEGMRARGILIGRIGPAMDVLKIRPPLPFSRAHADRLTETLEQVLAHLPA